MMQTDIKRVGYFEKVTYEQFLKDCKKLVNYDVPEKEYEDIIKEAYYSIIMPNRTTDGSAGFDFTCPLPFDGMQLTNPTEMVIPTGIKCFMEPGVVLNGYPRSSIGVKKKIMMCNTVGIIDQDYYNNDSNEGHIMFFLKTIDNSSIRIDKGERFAQTIFMPYFAAYKEYENKYCSLREREGGYGSTGN